MWDKKAHGMGDLKGSFAPRYEAIIFATKGRYELPGKRPDDLIACAKVGNQNLTHPNEKPVALLEQLIEAIRTGHTRATAAPCSTSPPCWTSWSPCLSCGSKTQ